MQNTISDEFDIFKRKKTENKIKKMTAKGEAATRKAGNI